MKFLILLLVLFFMGCSEPDLAPHFTENRDAGADAGSDVEDDTDELGADVDEEDSDDIEEPGECADSPCDELIEHPQCKQATCDDLLGCSFQNIREALSCDAPGIRDGRCQAGQCTGTICTCDTETECCDGCLPINDGAACDDGDPATGADACQAGQCVGEPCECSEGACCDGCFLLERDTVCDDEPARSYNVCDGTTRYKYAKDFLACDGVSSECDDSHTIQVVSDQGGGCYNGKLCRVDPVTRSALCTY